MHLASKEGHVDVIKVLLNRKADIAKRDHLGRNCLDLAIENNQKGAAIAILNSEHWKSALRNCTIEGNKVTTPMRKLIKKLPGLYSFIVIIYEVQTNATYYKQITNIIFIEQALLNLYLKDAYKGMDYQKNTHPSK